MADERGKGQIIEGIGIREGVPMRQRVNPLVSTRLEMVQVPYVDMQAEIAKSRILEAVNQHILTMPEELATDISFSLDFSLSF